METSPKTLEFENLGWQTYSCFNAHSKDQVKYFSNLATRRRSDVVSTSLWTSQQRRRYISNKTPSDVSVERCQDFSVVRLHGILLERCDDVLRGRNNDVPSERLRDFSNRPQMKHLTTSQWYVTKTSQQYISANSPVSPK